MGGLGPQLEIRKLEASMLSGMPVHCKDFVDPARPLVGTFNQAAMSRDGSMAPNGGWPSGSDGKPGQGPGSAALVVGSSRSDAAAQAAARARL